jgi:hypothetical protein
MACTQYIGFSDLPSIYNISLPVGPNMPNLRADVLLVQTLIKLANFTTNTKSDNSVEASSTIEVNGRFDDQTKRLIEAFEVHVRENHLLLIDNGIIEPSSSDGYTSEGVIYKIIHLNRIAKQSIPFGYLYELIPLDPTTDPLLRQSLANARAALVAE